MRTRLVFVRHGEVEQTGCLLGHTDMALSANGIEDVALQVNKQSWITSDNIAAIYTSPLQRCMVSAQSAAATMKLNLHAEPQLQEMNFGEFDGQRYETLWQAHKEQIEAFYAAPNQHQIVGAESYKAFYQRVVHAISCISAANSDKTVLIFTHAGVIRVAVMWCLGLSSDAPLTHQLAIDYASTSVIDVFQTAKEPIKTLVSMNHKVTLNKYATTKHI